MRLYSLNPALPILLIPLLVVNFACSSAKKKAEAEKQTAAAEKQLEKPDPKIQELEAKLSFLSDKLETMRVTIDNLSNNQEPKTSSVPIPSSEYIGDTVPPTKAPNDPDKGFVNDNAVKNYRQAILLFQSQKYPEAVLAFSAFLERFADHPLAGSAQFYVGESYFRQNEHKLAIQEFQRVLTSYDRSSHISLTLKQIAAAEEALKQTAEAVKHKQLLTSLFPQSPAANSTTIIPSKTDPLSEESSEEHLGDDQAKENPSTEKIRHAVNEVLTKTNSVPVVDEPPPTAPLPSEIDTPSDENETKDVTSHELE
ncbi:MAG: hypothetical protein A3K03_01005 [Bdellovibrionales bacterium RIFOXYD1_FULL_44_7]|nr:MAG: hypothetical protein A3K03_01005 [Bdellovibrionales bacterium RIFOXYD1_FULL_44_7]